MPKIFSHITPVVGVIISFVLIYLCVHLFFWTPSTSSSNTSATKQDTPCIVIDAGHGGKDPGKIGINGSLEKDINLSISLKLKKILENKGFTVYLTRDSDTMLSSENSQSPKREDMAARVKMIQDICPVFTVSIHQNSFTSESTSGPQVFYYSGSKGGKELADSIQKHMNRILCPGKSRSIQKNDTYYMLKNTPTPTVIVECGFLSNPTEAELLTNEFYQLKVARSIYFGISEYYNSISQISS